jgi:hypothetical protein
MAALIENGKVHLRIADGARVIALRNHSEEYGLRLDDYRDAAGVLIGEGGHIQVKQGHYLCWTEAQGHHVVDEPTFAKTHQLYVESVQG